MDRESKRKLMLLNAILGGVQVESQMVAFSPDEYSIKISPSGDVEISITPNTTSTRTALAALAKRIILETQEDKHSENQNQQEKNAETVKQEKTTSSSQQEKVIASNQFDADIVKEKRKIAIFKLAKEKNIPIEEIAKFSQKLGKKTSAEWDEDDISKIGKFIEEYINHR